MSEGLGFSEGLGIWRCAKCGAGFFPKRLLCLRCESPEFVEARVHEAVVEEITVVRHVLGQTDWKPRRIASCRTSEGQLITVGLQDDSQVGTRIALSQDGTAAVGREKTQLS